VIHNYIRPKEGVVFNSNLPQSFCHLQVGQLVRRRLVRLLKLHSIIHTYNINLKNFEIVGLATDMANILQKTSSYK